MITFEKTRDRGCGQWKHVLVHFGIDPKVLDGKHHPCPICGGTDRFRFDDLHGDGTYYCNQCGAGTSIKLLMAKLNKNFPETCADIDAYLGKNTNPSPPMADQAPAHDPRLYMGKVWRESHPVSAGDAAGAYLAKRCGGMLIPAAYLTDLRFHPALQHSVTRMEYPALIAGMGWNGKKYSGIHRTYLTPNGDKAKVDPVRMAYGEMGAIRLGQVAAKMGIAEGIETALCASLRFGFPVWSAICAEGLKAWEPPPEAKDIVIFGDNDANFTGQAAAFALANRLVRKGLHVSVEIPEPVGTDWADFITQVAV